MRYQTFFLLLALAFWVGCGNPQVTGVVKYEDGTPLTTGSVGFIKGATSASGEIQANGKYVMSTLKTGDGIEPGSYKVTVVASTGGGSDGEPLVQLVDPKFGDPSKSGLTCEVKGSMTYDITVTKPEVKK